MLKSQNELQRLIILVLISLFQYARIHSRRLNGALDVFKKKTRPIAISRVLRAISDRPTDGRTDKVAYRVECTRIKDMAKKALGKLSKGAPIQNSVYAELSMGSITKSFVESQLLI